jgi:hypothetical protein
MINVSYFTGKEGKNRRKEFKTFLNEDQWYSFFAKNQSKIQLNSISGLEGGI